MKRFVPHSNVGYPVMRSEYMGSRILTPFQSYIIDDAIALMFEKLQASGQEEIGEMEDIQPRPLVKQTERLLILCPGGIGDLICMKAALLNLKKWYPNITDVLFVSQAADGPIFLDVPDAYGYNIAVVDYPVLLHQAETYDAWTAFGNQDRQSLMQDLIVSYAQQLGSLPPEDKAFLVPSHAIQSALQGLISDGGRPKVGIQIYSAAHYRSWHAGAASIAMEGLVEAGCDCYIIGTSKQRIQFRDGDGVAKSVWGNGKYDVSGMLTTVEELIAFVDMMDLVIAPDSSALHIGCTLDKPTIGLFGLTDGAARTRYYDTLIPLNGEADCAPCWCIIDAPPCELPLCEAMMSIGPDVIVETAVEALRKDGLIG